MLVGEALYHGVFFLYYYFIISDIVLFGLNIYIIWSELTTYEGITLTI